MQLHIKHCQWRNVLHACHRQTGELAFVSERDGNMELYKGGLKGGRVNKHSLKRLTFHPSLQVCLPTLEATA